MVWAGLGSTFFTKVDHRTEPGGLGLGLGLEKVFVLDSKLGLGLWLGPAVVHQKAGMGLGWGRVDQKAGMGLGWGRVDQKAGGLQLHHKCSTFKLAAIK